jgi:ribosomal-protein-alanine N-acetyltransferase
MQEKIDKDYISGNTIHWGIADVLTDDVVGTSAIIVDLTKEKVNWVVSYYPEPVGKGR